jgi:hypothetical protein
VDKPALAAAEKAEADEALTADGAGAGAGGAGGEGEEEEERALVLVAHCARGLRDVQMLGAQDPFLRCTLLPGGQVGTRPAAGERQQSLVRRRATGRAARFSLLAPQRPAHTRSHTHSHTRPRRCARRRRRRTAVWSLPGRR